MPEPSESASSHFAISRLEGGLYRWTLIGPHQRVLLESILYFTKADALRSVQVCKEQARADDNFARMLGLAERPSFLLRDPAGIALAMSNLFESEPSRDSAILLCKVVAKEAPIDDQTLGR